VVQLGLASEARASLLWTPGDRRPAVPGIDTPAHERVPAQAIASCVDLTLTRSGEQFPVENLVKMAR
jgi:hypothetical protein